MKHMQKGYCLLLALVLALSLGMSAQAEEIALEQGQYVNGMVSSGEDALVLSNGSDGMSIHKIEDGQLKAVWNAPNTYYSESELLNNPEKMAEQAARLTTLLGGDDGVYAYADYGRQLYRLNGAAFDKTGPQLSGAEFEYQENGRSYMRSMRRGIVQDGKLLAFFDGDESTNYESIVYRFDLQTGEGTQLEVEGLDYVQSICAYKDAQVIVCYQSPEHDYDMVLRALDMNTGAFAQDVLAVMESYNGGGVAYDAPSDTIYYMDGGRVYKTTAGAQPEIIAYPPASYASGAAIVGGQYMLASESTLYVYPLDGSAVPETVITVQGGYVDDAYRAFLRENPSVGVALVDDWYSGSAQIADAIKTGEKGIDIFQISISNGLYAVLNKGYALDLSGSQVISQAVESYYPNLAAALKNEDGAIMAVYAGLYEANGILTVNNELWERFDLGEYPTTYGELIDLIALWEDEYAQENPEYVLYQFTEKDELVHMVINGYIAQYEGSEEGLRFDSPVLREVLEKIEALPIEPIDWESMTDADYEELNERYNRDQILNQHGNAMGEGGRLYANSGAQDYTAHVLDPLVFEQGQTPVLRMNGNVFIVNPESQNKELAIRYLEARVTHMDKDLAYRLTPSLTEPVRVENFEKTVESMQKSLEEMQLRMEAAEDVDKADFQQSIDYYIAWLDNQEENQWRLSAQGIERYREIGEYATTLLDSIFLNYDGESTGMEQIYEVIARYIDGQLNLDAFLREIDQKASMIILEGR